MTDTTHDHANRGRQDWKYRIFLGVLGSFFILYILIAFTHRAREPYFFFSWFVFSNVPSPHQVEHDVRLLSVDGKALPAPLSIRDARGAETVKGVYLSEYYRRTEVFARENGAIPENKRLIDELIVAPKATYELVEVKFNPIDRYRTGAIEGERVISTFIKG